MTERTQSFGHDRAGNLGEEMESSCGKYGRFVLFVQEKYGPTVLPNRNKESLAYAFPMEFGDRLRQARKAMKMTQEELGAGLGVSEPDVSKQTVYGWEKNNHFPTVRQLALICKRLGCSADWLIFGVRHEIVDKEVVVAKEALSKLTDAQRDDLLASMSRRPVSDAVLEKRMPAVVKKREDERQ